MIKRIKRSRTFICRIILSVLFVVCLSIIFRIEPTKNIEFFAVKAESSDSNIVIENWGYFSSLEESYRSGNPNATYEEMYEYLENEILKVKQGDVMIPANSATGDSSYSIFGDSVSSAELALVVEDPISAIIAYIASKDARNKMDVFYDTTIGTQLNNADAFRHAYWNALMTKRMDENIAETFANTHEDGQTSLSSQMDLANNALGRNEALTYSELDEHRLSLKIAEHVSYGHYWKIEEGIDELVETDFTGLDSKYVTLFQNEYTITLVLYDGMTNEITVRYNEEVAIDYVPYRTHYEFKGYYNEDGECCVRGVVRQIYNNYYQVEPECTMLTWLGEDDETWVAQWERLTANYSITVVSIGNGYLDSRTVSITSGQSMTLNANTPSGYTFSSWDINGTMYQTENVTYMFELHRSYTNGNITIYNPNFTGSAAYSDGYISLYFQKNEEEEGECVAAGTLITLADGRQVPVESLTGNERLLVWNLHTGSFDSAPILFIDHDEATIYRVINLYFSDGTHVKVIHEHAFWDVNLNKYVFLREDAGRYIGHWFNKQTTDELGNMIWTSVQLTNVTITEEYTTAWSPVTYGHLCIYVNGMLSMPGATEGLINIFEVDGDTMQINQEQYLADIAEYGLFTYEEFAEIYPVPEIMFEACGGEYLKVSIGKGLITYEDLAELIARYSEFFE